MGTSWRRAASSALLALGLGARPVGALEVTVERGFGGVVPEKGVDVVTVTVREPSGRGVVRLGGAEATFDDAGSVRLGRDAGDDGPVAVEVRTERGSWRGVAPPARRVARPVLVAGVDPGAIVDTELVQGGEPVIVPAERLPAEWPAYDGVAAVLLDTPTAARLDEPRRLALARYLARGGAVCVAGEPPRCARGERLPVPPALEPAVDGVVPAALLRWALAGLLAAAVVALGVLRRLRPLCLAAPLVLALAPLGWSAPPEVRARGVQVTGGAEDQVLGRAAVVAPLGGTPPLGEGSWWIRRAGAFFPLVADRWPGDGTWRVDGFVAPGRGPWLLPTVPRRQVTPPW